MVKEYTINMKRVKIKYQKPCKVRNAIQQQCWARGYSVHSVRKGKGSYNRKKKDGFDTIL